jgi:hypothetical protein
MGNYMSWIRFPLKVCGPVSDEIMEMLKDLKPVRYDRLEPRIKN